MSNPQVEKVAEAIYKATGLPKPWEAMNTHDRSTYLTAGKAAIEALRPTISTVEQLKALPRGSVVMSADERPFRRWPAEDGQDYWTSGQILLPAFLLFEPCDTPAPGDTK